jgi:hypothetical protein
MYELLLGRPARFHVTQLTMGSHGVVIHINVVKLVQGATTALKQKDPLFWPATVDGLKTVVKKTSRSVREVF